MPEEVIEGEGTEKPEDVQDSQEPNVEGEGEQEEVEDTPKGGTTDWKAEARKWEQRAKKDAAELKKAREEMTSGKEGTSSDDVVKQLQDQVQALLQENADAKREAAITKVASDKKLTGEQVELLQGDTLEELEAYADKLLKAFGGNADKNEDAPAKGARTPKENLRPGTAGGSAAGGEDPAEIAKAVLNSGF